MACKIKYQKEIINTNIKYIKSNFNNAISNENIVRIPYNDSNKKSVLKQVKDITSSLNNKYVSEDFGDTFSIVENLTHVTININPPDILLDALTSVEYEDKNNLSYSPKKNNYTGYQFQNFSSFSKYIHLKENELSRLKNKLSSVKYKKNKEQNKELYKKYVRIQEKIEDLIEEVEIQISSLENTPKFEVLSTYFKSDLEKVEDFIFSKDLENLQQVEEILDFYENVFTKGMSPFFSDEELEEEKYSELIDKMKPYRDKANFLRNKMDTVIKSIITKEINKQSNVKKMFGKSGVLNEDLFFEEDGLKDINILTSYLQSPSYQIGLSSYNGLLPQFAETMFTNAHHEPSLMFQHFMKKIKDLQPKVMKRLGTKRFGHLTYVDYNIFRAKSKNGLLKDSIITRYISDIYTEKIKIEKSFSKKYFSTMSMSLSDSNKNTVINSYRSEVLDFYHKNFIILDLLKTPEIADKYSSTETDVVFNVDENYKKEIIKEVGEKAYNEMIKNQIDLIENYNMKLEVFKENLDFLKETGSITERIAESRLKNFKKQKNPFKNSEKLKYDKLDVASFYQDLNVAMIPRKYKRGTNTLTGFHDENFIKIENDEVLSEFYDVLKELSDDISSSLSPEDRKNMNLWSLPTLSKSLQDILADPTMNYLEKIYDIFKRFMDWIRNLRKESIQGYYSHSLVNPTTKLSDDKIFIGELKFNKREIDLNTDKDIMLLMKALGYKKIRKRFKKNLTISEEPVLISYIAKKLNISPNINSISKAMPNLVLDKPTDINTLVKELVTDEILQKQTLDLPKVMMVAAKTMVGYKVRQNMLPLQKVIKQAYLNIKENDRTRQGIDIKTKIRGEEDENIEINVVKGARNNANEQYKSWYRRVILNKKNKDLKVSPFLKKQTQKLGGILDKINIKKLKVSEKPGIKELKDIKNTLEIEFSNTKSEKQRKQIQNAIFSVEKIISSNTKRNSASQIVSKMIYDLVRFTGLAYNLNSSMTNYIEGQISNLIAAASGRYFKEENYYEALAIMQKSIGAGFTFNLTDKANLFKKSHIEIKLASTLMERYDLLEDVYDELQKASAKSKLSKLSFLNPKTLTNKVEYQNQTVVMIAVLKETMIKDKNGVEKDVWSVMVENAMNGGEIGNLTEDFKTPKNRLSYEVLDKEEINSIKKEYPNIEVNKAFQTRISETIIKLHGDYNSLRGGRMDDSLVGQAMLMFKRWVGSMLYNRFGVEHRNIAIGITEKGRYRSMSKASMITAGAVVGLSISGPLGAAIYATVGGAFSHAFSLRQKEEATLTLAKEMIVLNTMLFKRFLSMPINRISGKLLIDPNSLGKDSSKMGKAFKDFESSYENIDIENIKANLTELSYLLWTVMLSIITRASLKDDDDEDNSKSRNIIINKLNQLQQQIIAFSNPYSLYESFSSVAALRLFENLGKEIDTIIGLIRGEDEIKSGIYKGQSKFKRQTKKTFLPSILRDNLLGFESSSKMQYVKTPWDKMFMSESDKINNELHEIRANIRKRLKSDNFSTEEIDKIIRKTYKKRKTKKYKGETYKENLKRLKDPNFYNKMIEEYEKNKKNKKK